jgi:lauroyl/myristoyl acyltransferase
MKTSAEETAARLRARVPRALLPALVAARTRLAWRRPAVREDARAQMRFLLEGTRFDADLDTVARAYVRYQARRGELRWHPELITGLRVEGMDHLRAVRAEGRGVVLNFAHHGYYDGAFPSIARLGVRSHMVCYPYMIEPDAPAWLRQHVKVAMTHGNVAVSAAVGTDGMLDLLRRGEVLALASDVPGRTPLRFAGRDVLGSFGAARLALTAGASVVVLTSEEDARGPFIRLHEPLDPAGFATPEALLERMLAIHESVQLRWPEATDIPLSRWGVAQVSTSGAAPRVESRAAS